MTRAISESARRFARQAIRFLLPDNCAACGSPLADDPIPHFCASCWETIPSLPQARCLRCDRPFASPVATAYSPNHVCHSCAKRPPSYTKAWTLYPYLPPLRDAICLYKYRGKLTLASPLVHLMINKLPPLDDVDLVMPVPLHAQRLREREFNQSLFLADPVSRHLNAPLSYTNLVRVAPSPAQTTLSRKERLRNLRGAFALRRPELVSSKRILLVDDVFTTGATVNECAKTLRKSGSGDVFVVTLGRTMDASTTPDRPLSSRVRPAFGPNGA
jgi:ComF family protein